MSKRLLTIFSLICAMLIITVSTVMAQDLRPEKTGFIKPRVGVSSYLGDNEKSPTNLNFDMYKIDGKLPFNVALELGYQFSVPFSISLAYQFGNYPIITQFGEEEGNERGINDDPTTRHSIQAFGRYTFANARTKVAPYVDFGLSYSFGSVAQQVNNLRSGQEKSGGSFGPLLGIGLDVALNDRTSFFVEAVSGIHISDDLALDANESNGLGSSDILTGIGLGLKINFKRAFTPVQLMSLDCSMTLNPGETGNFVATINETASQPVEVRWDFGDGNTATGLMTTHSFANPGDYTVTVTATNSGSTDSGSCSVNVPTPAEIVTVTSSKTRVSICDSDQAINFSANARGEDLTFNWDFGDGSSSTEANPSHTYGREGTFTVTLTLTNAAGTDTRTTSVTVTDEGCFNCNITQMNSVFFDRNSSVLTEQARMQLAENLEILLNCPNINAQINGYASRDERNAQLLSEDRARAVEQYYIDGGIAAGRLQTQGLGATGQTTKKGGASQFRRVDTIPQQ